MTRSAQFTQMLALWAITAVCWITQPDQWRAAHYVIFAVFAALAALSTIAFLFFGITDDERKNFN